MSRGATRKGTDDSQYTLRAAAADAVGWAVVQRQFRQRRCDDLDTVWSVKQTDSPSVDEETAERETTLGMMRQ